jgi:hypothetical protein
MNQVERAAILELADAKLPNAKIYEARTSLESFKLYIHATMRIGNIR